VSTAGTFALVEDMCELSRGRERQQSPVITITRESVSLSGWENPTIENCSTTIIQYFVGDGGAVEAPADSQVEAEDSIANRVLGLARGVGSSGSYYGLTAKEALHRVGLSVRKADSATLLLVQSSGRLKRLPLAHLDILRSLWESLRH
jgi:hypothetical protein